MCIRALQLESSDGNSKATICKTLSCLLPDDLEVNRACQLTEFLLEPTVDAYYAVESLYNEPDQKLEEEKMAVPNSLRCELLLVFKTQWPFDPEFWDWRALKRQCLALMGEEASIVSSIDLLNDNEDLDDEGHPSHGDLGDVTDPFMNAANETDRLWKNREMKRLRAKGFVSARFRNFQAYMQYCVLCDKEFLGHRIVRHAQTHFQGGVYTCPICAEKFTSKDTLLPHVASHVKQSCKERLTAMKANKKLADSRTAAPVMAALKAKSENFLHTNGDSQGQSGGSSLTARTAVSEFQAEIPEENVCPVSICKKGFKFLKNLLAHVKAHGDNQEAKRFLEMQCNKVVCQYCRRQFVNVAHLNDHLQVHCGINPYICIQLNCKASFQSNPELLVHRKSHSVFKARCMFLSCGKIFNDAYQLYDHEAQHYKTFTCTAPDCGRIFYSHTQLELHQKEHAAQMSPEELQIPQQNSQQNPEPIPQQNSELNPEQLPQQNSLNAGPSLIERMLSDSSLDMAHESKDFQLSLPVNSIEGLLASPRLLQDYGQYAVKIECEDTPLSSASHTQGLDTTVIWPSVNSHFSSHTNRPMTSQETNSFDHLRATLQSHSTSSFEAPSGGINMSNTGQANAFEDQTPMFSPNQSSGLTMYSSNCNVTYPQQFQPTCTNTLLTNPSDNAIPLGVCLPQSVTPLPPSGIRPGSVASYPVNPTAPSAVQRYHCAFENCTRNYACYRSVAKHMRVVHPEFYSQWKIAKRNARNPPTMLLAVRSVGSTRPPPPPQASGTETVPMHAIQRQVGQPLPYPTMDPSSSYTSQPTSIMSHDVPMKMENILNPIVISQLACPVNPVTPMQSQVAPNPQWLRNPGNGQIPAQVYPSNMQGMPQVALPLGPPMDLPLIPKAPHSVSPSYNNSTEVVSPEVGKSLNGNGSVSNYIPQALTKAAETDDRQMQAQFPSSSSSDDQYQKGQTCKSLGDAKNKRRRKTRWPAIIRDGKYICSRCFRQFNCSKSLGGHLSSRVTCKPLLGSQQGLPASFLDFLNSEQTENTFSSPSLHDQSALYPEGPSQSVLSAESDPTAFPASAFPQADLSEMGTADDILKQIMAEANMGDLFDQESVSQPFFQGTFGGVERTPQNSVIQHTGDVHIKEEDPFYLSPYLESSIPPYSSPSFPDPVLSQILSENQNARPHPQSLPVEHVTASQQTFIIFKSEEQEISIGQHSLVSSAGHTNQRTDISTAAKQPISIGQHSMVPSGVNQGMTQKHTEQDVKKRLREQILSGDFTQRSGVCHSGHVKASANSKSPGSFSSTGSPSNILHHSPSVSRQISRHIDPLQGFSSQKGGTPTLTNMVEQNKPVQLSGVHRPWGMDGHSTFGKPQTVGDVNGTSKGDMKSETGSTNHKLDILLGLVKPFACDAENCTFRAMSSDVLWKHMVRVHRYTLEMINEVKLKNPKLAPFGCLKCDKAFTRNSNLRVHYQSAHQISMEEATKLHVKPCLARVVQSPSNQNQSPTGAAQSATTYRAFANESLSVRDPSKHQPPLIGHQTSKIVPQQNSPNDNMFTQVHRHPSAQHRPVKAEPSQYFADCHGRLHLKSVGTPPGPLPSVSIQSSLIAPLDQSQSTKQTPASSFESQFPEVKKEKKSNAPFNHYRPYCCVHKGCTAAFTIQHNLILHYRAIHQSALSVLEVKKEQDGTEAADESEEEEEDEELADSDNEVIPEFRCQEKDCCRVFQEVPSLLQHYLQLHEFSLDKAGAILSRINLGRFACDQQGCMAMFTTFWKYVGHIKEMHGGVRLSRHETLSGFSCDVEDCDRMYATKYNLLRHTMKKHPETYQLKVMNQPIPEECAKQNSKISHNSHYPIVKANNGKENIESNKKLQKGCEKKRLEKMQKNNWTKYGKPSLKSKGEASAMCTKTFTLQYPCMLKGCESVMRSERSIMKHYMGHGLSERYLEEQRSHFIFCKKFSRYKHRSNRSDDSKSENSSDLSDNDLMTDTGLGGSGYGSAKLGLRKRVAPEMSGGFFDGSLTKCEDSDSVELSEEPIVVKRKRGRPRKVVGNVAKPKPARRPVRKTRIVYPSDEETDSCDSSAYLALTPDYEAQLSSLTTFTPMGFEVSFLKFLEHSKPPQLTPARSRGRPPGKNSSHTKDTCVEFSNRQNLESLGQVKILVDGAYSTVAAHLLKQLQDMRPTVILEKND